MKSIDDCLSPLTIFVTRQSFEICGIKFTVLERTNYLQAKRNGQFFLYLLNKSRQIRLTRPFIMIARSPGAR